ncbi:MAG: fumarate reductase/succinate dehydrogenase flavoprotein subunit [SAR324 cluster bacterium]|nr:fumarate reductase/succinate dehydrogenase flavoprotein subunit [SAR324 cluster bacterium]
MTNKKLQSSIPEGKIENKWDKHKFNLKLVNPSNRRKYDVMVVGSGLAGASAASSLAEMGYNVTCICYQDSSRRAHSIAAQGGINATKNYHNDGDSIYRLFYDTIKGGDYRSREANVYRLAQLSGDIIDQCVAQGVPFARDYGGTLANRSFGGAQLSRTFYARGQTGQQLLLGAYSALSRQVGLGKVKMLTRREFVDLVLVDGVARGVLCRNHLTGKIERHSAHAICLATGGYSPVFYLSTSAVGCNVTAAYRSYKRGAFFANPSFTQIHPTCIPLSGNDQSKLTLMSESLRNDARVWVPKQAGDKRDPVEIVEDERDYFLERKYPSFGNLVPRDVASRNAKMVCDEGRGVGENGLAVYMDFSDAINRLGRKAIEERYGNLFDMYQHITNENPYQTPMKISPAVHYTMGGLWVDYNLMSNIPGLFVLGEANFSDHGANRLGASALMQGLADGYFIAPYALGNYLATQEFSQVSTEDEAFTKANESADKFFERLMGIKGNKSAKYFHKKLGTLLWDKCGMSRNAEGLREALAKIPEIRKEFWSDLSLPGDIDEFNPELEHASRVADFLEFAEIMCHDALNREESCGGHFREEHQTEGAEAQRDDDNFSYVAAWQYQELGEKPILHKEELEFTEVVRTRRQYK